MCLASSRFFYSRAIETRHMLLYVRIHTCCRLTRGKGNTDHGTRSTRKEQSTKKHGKYKNPTKKLDEEARRNGTRERDYGLCCATALFRPVR